MTDRSCPSWLILAGLTLVSAGAWAQDAAPTPERVEVSPAASPASADAPAPSTNAPKPTPEPAESAPPAVAAPPSIGSVPTLFEAEPSTVRLDGQVVFDYVQLGEFAVDADGTPSDRGVWGHSRVVLGLEWDALSYATIITRVEALSGTAFGDLSTLGDAVGIHTLNARRNTEFGIATAALRESYVDIDVLVGRLKIGLQGVHWGTGMLVNNGLTEPDFGRAYRGNIADRILFGTKPFALTPPYRWMEDLTLFVAVDSAVRDDNAYVLREDSALGAVFGALVDHRRTKIGLITSYRSQEDRLDIVGSADVYP